MFVPSQPPELANAGAVSDGSAALRARAPSTPRRAWRSAPRLRHLLKFAAAALVLAVGAGAELVTLLRVQSSEAVVSAPRLVVRTPINGIVTSGGGALGRMVHRGEAVARIENPLASRLPLDELRARVARLTAELSAATRRGAALAVLEDELQRREERHAQFVALRLDSEIAGADAAVAASAARRDQAQRDLARRRVLASGGDVAQADLERSQTLFDAASQDERQQEALRGSLRAQREAAAQGVYAEPGPNEVSYAAQRRDEVAMRRNELDQQAAGLRAELAQTDTLARATEADFARRAGTDILAPADSVVWRTGAQQGDVVAAGDVVAELVACDRAVVVAAIAQRDLEAISVGGPAKVQLAGETGERSGIVIATVAEAAVGGDPRLAAVPADLKASSAMALVTLDPPATADAGCLVGRTARVVLPRADAGMLRSLLARVL